MTPIDKQDLELKLTREISATLDRVFEEAANNDLDVPWVGENTSYWMAKAAVAVLMAMDDAQDYMRRYGMLND